MSCRVSFNVADVFTAESYVARIFEIHGFVLDNFITSSHISKIFRSDDIQACSILEIYLLVRVLF